MTFTVPDPMSAVDLAERSLQDCWSVGHGDDWLTGFAFFVERVRDAWDAVDEKCGYTSVTASAFRIHALGYLKTYLAEIEEDVAPELDQALANLGGSGHAGGVD